MAFTIAVTIVRGSIFGGVYKSITPDNVRSMNVTWIWFWFALEYIVGEFYIPSIFPQVMHLPLGAKLTA